MRALPALLCAAILFSTSARGEDLSLVRFSNSVRSVLLDVGERTPQMVELFRQYLKHSNLANAEVADASTLDEAVARDKFKQPFMFITTLDGKSKWWEALSRGVGMRLDNDTLHWHDFAAPVKDLRVGFVANNPLGSGFGLVYAAGNAELLKNEFSDPDEEMALVIEQAGTVVRRGCYGEDLAVKACTPLPTVESAHVKTTYSRRIEEKWARANTEVLEAARNVYIRDFGYEMPEHFTLQIQCCSGPKGALFIKPEDNAITMQLASLSDLAKPPASPYKHIFGMCHELGHSVYYRWLKHPQLFTTDAAEEWANYMGARCVDLVYRDKGESIWPEPYDYRIEGEWVRTNALKSHSTADAWIQLGKMIRDDGFIRLFKAWSGAPVDPANPAVKLGEVLSVIDFTHSVALQEYWKWAAPVLINSRRALDAPSTVQ